MNRDLLRTAYLATRRRLESKGYDSRASRALEMARGDIERGQTLFFTESGLASYQNQPSERGGRWIESPEAAGLRFVGFADAIAGRAVDHTGWLTDDEGMNETARGAVYQLPARNGRPIYVEAIRTGRESGQGWKDESRDGAAIVFLGELHHGERDNGDSLPGEAAREAAMGADQEARIYAEAEREWQEAWRAGQSFAEERAAVSDMRRGFLALRAEIKAAGERAAPAICRALAERLESYRSAYDKAKAKAAELWADRPSGRLAEAWADGADMPAESIR